MKYLYFCRHGLSEDNKAAIFSGHTNTPLSDEGREQARLAGLSAKGLGIDHIIASPLSRAHDTARIIAEQIGYKEHDIELNSLLMERNFGSLEGQPWSPDFDVDGISDVETHDSLKNRVELAYRHIQTIEADCVLVVAHAGVGRMLRHIINPAIPFRFEDPEQRAAHRFENAVIVQLL